MGPVGESDFGTGADGLEASDWRLGDHLPGSPLPDYQGGGADARK